MEQSNLFIVIGIVIFIVIIWYIVVSNKIKTLNIKIDESLSGIDVALTKRYDVITQMVEVVKGYAKHEKEVLTKVIEIRKNMSLTEKNAVNKAMNEKKDKINVVVENYPELKANENFKVLQKSILDVEEHLQAARRCYNANVSLYNQMISSFPSVIVAKSKKMVEKEFFEAEESKKENVKVDL